jgi:NAD(P)-dependent dehydrogenase (short-subunit alcohol dehydrogenase family)
VPFRSPRPAAGRRILITGAARGIGAALAHRLHQRGARVALLGIEASLLGSVAERCGDAPWMSCDITDRVAVDDAVPVLVDRLGGLDVVVANAGVAAQLPLLGGDPEVMDRTIAVNVLGTYNTIRAAGPHISHADGYALLVASLAAAIHLPLLGAYSASKAAVEALGNTLRIELGPCGARVGVAYFSELDTDMTSRGFGTEAAAVLTGGGSLTKVTPVEVGIDALERGIARRSRRVVAPAWVGPLLPVRMAVQPVMDRYVGRRVARALEVARDERPLLTTPQPDERP